MALKIDDSGLQKGLSQATVKLGATVLMFASTKAMELESYMKNNRPWTDRTGMAKTTLNARVSQPSSNKVRIILAHGVSYGMWLELAHGGKYNIIKRTIDTEGPKVLKSFTGLMAKLK